ncbi:hypothetical protein D3C81_1705330 [compost metagenome]
MFTFDQVHIAPAHQVDWQAIVNFQYCIGMRLAPACLHALLAQLLGLGLVPGHYQQVAVRFTKYLRLVTAQVDEEQPRVIRPWRQLAERDTVAIDTVDLQPRVDVQACTAAEPAFAQLRVRLLQGICLREQHIVYLDTGPWVAATEHDYIQHEQFLEGAEDALFCGLYRVSHLRHTRALVVPKVFSSLTHA